MCTVLLPPGVNPIAVNKYIIYHITNVAPYEVTMYLTRLTVTVCIRSHELHRQSNSAPPCNSPAHYTCPCAAHSDHVQCTSVRKSSSRIQPIAHFPKPVRSGKRLVVLPLVPVPAPLSTFPQRWGLRNGSRGIHWGL